MRKDDRPPLPTHLRAQVEALETQVDDPVDLSDMPEVKDWSRVQRGWSNHRKRTVTVSLDVALVDYVEKAGSGSLDDRLNALLRDWVSNSKQAAE